MRYANSSDQSLNHVRALLYGDAGIGKTTSLKTLCQNETVIVVTERGALPLRHNAFAIVWIEAWSDFPALVKGLSDPAAFAEKLRSEGVLPPGFTKLTTFALDSLSAASALCMRHILTKERPAFIGDRTSGKTTAPKGIYSDTMTH